MNPLFLKSLVLLLLIQSLLLPQSGCAEPVPGKLLFAPAYTQTVKLSPNTRYVMGEYYTDNGMKLILKDINSGKNHEIFRLSAQAGRRSNFQWVDNDTILVDFKGKSQYRAFIDIDIKGKTFESTVRTIKVKGEFVDVLERVQNTVLFSTIEGRILKENVLYTVTTDQLVNNQLFDASPYGEPLDDAIVYISEPENNRILAITLDGETAVIWYRQGNKKNWYRVGEINIRQHEFTPVGLLDSHTLAVLSSEKSDNVALVEFNLKTQSYGKILYQHQGSDLTTARLSKGTESIDYVRYFEQGRLITRFFSEQDKRLEQQIQRTFVGKQFLIVDQKRGFDAKLVFVFSADDPGRYYLYDFPHLKQPKPLLLGKVSRQLDDHQLSGAQTFTVQTDEHTQVEALLTLPTQNANGVLMVMPHGGPVGVREIDNFDPQVQYLASRGFAVLKVNFRGSAGFGKKFQDSGVGQLGKGIEHDITEVVKNVRAEHEFKQMCSIGTSYGGYSAMMLAMLHPQDYQCVISMFGVYDLPQLFSASNHEQTPAQQKLIRAVLGENNDALRLVSPFYMAQKLKAPLLLVAGTHDNIAWFEQSDRMRYRLKQLGKDFETLFYKNTGHGHDTYWGERHLFAYINQFVTDRLGLSVSKSSSADATQIAMDEALLLADGHEFNKLVGSSKDKALQHYRRAAELGESRSMFNVGHFYQIGEVVDKDMKQARKWYQKAADAGFADASFRLGGLYLAGTLGEVNPQKAIKFFQEAKNNGHETAFLEIAKAQCTGVGIKRDIAACVSTLTDENIVEKGMRVRRGEIIREVLRRLNLSPEKVNKLKASLKADLLPPTERKVPKKRYDSSYPGTTLPGNWY
ncbi:MAG: prolyl oligopeptidase family serine peptidase [Algicola sp.]|nr:prolyl oligopeptidase family serine peptidase [Algicola sp.]